MFLPSHIFSMGFVDHINFPHFPSTHQFKFIDFERSTAHLLHIRHPTQHIIWLYFGFTPPPANYYYRNAKHQCRTRTQMGKAIEGWGGGGGRLNCKWNRMNIKRIMEKEQRNLTNVTAISNTRYTRYTLYKSTLAHLQQQFVFKPNKTRHSIIWIQPSWDPLKETVALSARKREKKKKREFFTH